MKRYLITALLTFASLPTFANNNQSATSMPSQQSGQAVQPAKVAPPKPFGLESITLEQESKIRQIQVELQTKTQALSPSQEKMAKEVEQWTKVVQNEKFDEEKDHQFFNYLDRLVNAEEYRKRERIDGLGILREFVTDHASLTYAKKRNEQVKRWEDARKSRIEQGLPADPPEADQSLLQARLEALNNK